MINRFETALAIQDACNPNAVALEFCNAIDELRAQPNFEGTAHICRDEALRLIAFKLATLMRVENLEDQECTRLVDYCEEHITP